MNDPMEGFYQPSIRLKGQSNYRDIVGQITTRKSGVGIACFTETHEDVLMWTHYAGNYSGMCLGYSTEELLSGLPDNVHLVRLAYVDNPPLIMPTDAKNAGSAAIRILSQKKYNWAYEREWRVLGPVGAVELGTSQPVKSIYFGPRVELSHRQQVLTKIQRTGIKAYMMEVDGYEHNWEPINDAAKPKKKKTSKP